MTDTGTDPQLKHRTNQSTSPKGMDSEQTENDEDLSMGDNQFLLKGDNQQEKQYLSKEDNLQRKGISSMDVTVFGWTFNKVIAVTHFNIFLYATCFWIQTGTLPVGIVEAWGKQIYHISPFWAKLKIIVVKCPLNIRSPIKKERSAEGFMKTTGPGCSKRH